MASVGYIGEEQIKTWDWMLAGRPLINNDFERLKEYVNYINEKFQPKEKSADFGTVIQIADAIQGAQVGVDVFDDANRISAECNNRMFAHLLYNKEIYGFNFIDSNVASNPTPALVDMAVAVMNKFDLNNNDYEGIYINIGLKGIEYISKYILD